MKQFSITVCLTTLCMSLWISYSTNDVINESLASGLLIISCIKLIILLENQSIKIK